MFECSWLIVNKREICSGMNGLFSESCAPDEKNGIEKSCAPLLLLFHHKEETMHYTLDCLYIYWKIFKNLFFSELGRTEWRGLSRQKMSQEHTIASTGYGGILIIKSLTRHLMSYGCQICQTILNRKSEEVLTYRLFSQ